MLSQFLIWILDFYCYLLVFAFLLSHSAHGSPAFCLLDRIEYATVHRDMQRDIEISVD